MRAIGEGKTMPDTDSDADVGPLFVFGSHKDLVIGDEPECRRATCCPYEDLQNRLGKRGALKLSRTFRESVISPGPREYPFLSTSL